MDKRLRDKFCTVTMRPDLDGTGNVSTWDLTDGRREALAMLRHHGAVYTGFAIIYHGSNLDCLDAILFLCQEHKFTWVNKPPEINLDQ